ncbi:HupE/UreJ family protein [Bradyrhizobium ivorense]|uniref:HupE/UreJ family protein n=1 Tax=Bradyrhizobium ivorense TaxID=2511166 RepID=UPI0010B9405D|nr:HupE/UreJ family protein [Bradyrhizobium ivorense]VIO80975.1 hypothetical protein CI41S_76230 [Bradyrhizobium ivorense]
MLGLIIALALAWGLPAAAHDARPAYLEIKETAVGHFALLWRTPMVAGLRLPLSLKLPDGVADLRQPVVQETNDWLVERRWVAAGPEGLANRRIQFVGLEFTTLDALVRVELKGGSVLTAIARPSRPWIEIAATPGWLAVAGAYVLQGIDHILSGADHLLFVFALLILVSGARRLIATITAFTIAHSVTLAAATLGWIHVPAAPVEACIALSIMFVAAEIVHGVAGRPGLTARFPWVVAFAFGLLHGLGFAGALREVGLPQNAIPTALLFFNVGVELGQLMFIVAILAIGFGIRWVFLRLLPSRVGRQDALGQFIPAYAIGGVAAFWFVERIASFAN